jgi:hypothetical protein
LGIPIANSTFWHGDSYYIEDSKGNRITDVLCDPIAYWPNKSIKWLNVRFASSFKPKETRECKLLSGTATLPPELQTCWQETNEQLIIESPSGKLVFSKASLLAIEQSHLTAEGLILQNSDKQQHRPSVTDFSYQAKHNGKDYLYVDIQQQGLCKVNDQVFLHIVCDISVSIKSGEIRFTCSIHNPKAAKHADGKWDLGDENSAYFAAINWLVRPYSKEIPIAIELCDSQTDWPIDENSKVSLHQASSGEDHWQNPIHVTKDNTVNLPFRGYQLQLNTIQHEGRHAQPKLHFGGAHKQEDGVSSILDTTILDIGEFWQNFPSSIIAENKTLSVSVLGSELGPQTELQPGEQKTRTWTLSTSKHPKVSVQASLDAHYVAQTGVIFSHQQDKDSEPLQALIKAGLHGERNFFNKRKKSDSYGWRHFGELHADHETAQQPDAEYFVSHYNNQYDPIYGFLVQWLKTGEHQWFELADNLAKHVADIDVYHTELDKPDYSGGLFWHTDHYVQAYTATHRTYSVHQPSNVYDDHAGGGGPGGQHCYTQGLTLHYLFTGYRPSREATLKIAKWVETLYEGDNSLLSLAFAVKNRHRSDLKNIFTGRYPLDRGTGNYIQALLDSYELNSRPSSLSKVERVICATISASDDISDRQFNDVENTWFYTVFLQAVCRYLSVSASTAMEHAPYQNQILGAFLHYVNWMIENEYLYLDKPEILEFPNQTWTAQDLRKVCIVSFAAPFLTDPQNQKANDNLDAWLTGIIQRLSNHSEASTTRVLCLLMQNAHIHDYAQAGKQVYRHYNSSKASVSSAITPEAPPSFYSQIVKTLKTTSFSNERRALLRRFPQLSKWLGELR